MADPVTPTQHVTPITEEEFDVFIQEERIANKKLDISRYIKASKPDFFNRLVLHYGRDKADISTEGEVIKEQVTHFISSVTSRLSGDPRFRGEPTPCGSSAEGVKVRCANEFDFTLELSEESLSIEDLNLELAAPPAFRPRPDGSNIKELSLFLVSFKHAVPNMWQRLMKCKDCKSCDECQQRNHKNRNLCSRAVLSTFLAAVKGAASALMADNARTQDTMEADASYDGPLLASSSSINTDSLPESQNLEAHVTRNGPAATMFTKSGITGAPAVISIDLTMAITVQRKPSETWPLQSRLGDIIQLQSYLLENGQTVDKCYLIPTGDYWKLTFVSHEKELMKSILQEPNKKYCFQAVKYMKDTLSVTDDYESSLLSSYPLKVSFLKENIVVPGPWNQTSLGERAVSILGRVEEEGEVTSFYIENDPVMPGNIDKSFVEIRRIIQHMEDLVKAYGEQGRVHAILWIMIALFHFIFLTLSVEGLLHLILWCYFNWIDSFLLLILSPFNLLPPIFGFIWIKASKNCKTLYTMYRTLKWIYIVVLSLSITQIVISVYSDVCDPGAFYSFEAGSKKPSMPPINGTDQMLDATMSPAPCWTSCVVIYLFINASISAFVLLVICCHLLVICCSGREGCRRHTYPRRGKCQCCYFCCELVFFDPLYKDMCCSCNSSAENIQNTETV